MSGTLDLEANKRSQGAVSAVAGTLQHVSNISANDAACDSLTIAASGENGASYAGGIIGRALDCDTLTSNSLTSRQADISATCTNGSAAAGGLIGKSSRLDASECGVDVAEGGSLSLASYGRSWGSAATGGTLPPAPDRTGRVKAAIRIEG